MIKKLVIILATTLCVIPCFATTYYISPSGDNENTGESEGSPWKTFAYAFNNMVGGDELILLDGTYSNATGTGYINYNDGSNPLCGQPPSGTSLSNVTYIHAKNLGQAVIDGGTRPGLWIGRTFRKDSYIRIEGIRFEGGGILYNTSYNTVKNCAFHTSVANDSTAFGIGTNDHENGNSYNLVEDCWMWAANARGIAMNYRADYNVWRRVVIRGDGGSESYMVGSGNPNIGFSVYDSSNVSVQNMIIVDRILNGARDYSAFATAQHTPNAHLLGPNEWLGCIVLNNEDQGFCSESDQANDNTAHVKDFVAWDATYAGVNFGASNRNILVENITTGATVNGEGLRVAPEVKTGIVRNIISYNAPTRGINSAIKPTYCDVYGSAIAYNQAVCTVGARTTNPTNDGSPASLKYLVRIENGSALKGTGAGGADYGANVIYRYGADGTRYGEPGYNTLTTNKLWPYPNEARIKADMAADDARGFAAVGKQLNGTDDITLTSYIWEYLGNEIPADIYGESATTGLTISGGITISGGVQLR